MCFIATAAVPTRNKYPPSSTTNKHEFEQRTTQSYHCVWLYTYHNDRELQVAMRGEMETFDFTPVQDTTTHGSYVLSSY